VWIAVALAAGEVRRLFFVDLIVHWGGRDEALYVRGEHQFAQKVAAQDRFLIRFLVDDSLRNQGSTAMSSPHQLLVETGE